MMTQSYFWKMVDFMGWAAACASGEHRPYERIKKKFMDMYSEDEAMDFAMYHSAKYNELDSRLRAEVGDEISNGVYGGDDAYSDLLNQVIGQGSAFYYSVMADITLLDNLEPFESFSYCIPHVGGCMGDYEKPKMKASEDKERRLDAVDDAENMFWSTIPSSRFWA